jgi:UTP:GlnB (protein PII) uridylyltransferase
MSEEKQPEVSEEIEWEDAETTTRSDLISCAYYAISAVEDIDLTLVSKMEANRIKTIRRQSLDIIANVIGEMHAEIFDVNDDI